MKSLIIRFFSSIIIFILGQQRGINFLVFWSMAPRATTLINNRFIQLAPKKQRIATGNWFKEKWDFVGAGKFLLQCKTETAVAIFNQWRNNPQFKSHSHKPEIMMNLWLTLKPFEDDQEKIIEIAKLLAETNRDLVTDMLTNMANESAVILVEKVTIGPMNGILKDLPNHVIIPLLLILKNVDYDRFEEVHRKLPSGRAGELQGEMGEIEGYDIRTENFRKAEMLLGRLLPKPEPRELEKPEGDGSFDIPPEEMDEEDEDDHDEDAESPDESGEEEAPVED